RRKSSAGDWQGRLLREARAMAKLSHPNVVTVHDVVVHDDQLFIAMELIEGVSLREWLRAEPRTWREILDVFLHAGDGLAAAHAVGLVHRDFKPDNVLCDRRGRVCVTDFGLARAAAPSALDSRNDVQESPTVDETAAVTHTGAIFGTPGYMAPEQCEGRNAD